MKRALRTAVLGLALAAAVSFSLTGCGSSEKAEPAKATPAQSGSTPGAAKASPGEMPPPPPAPK